MTEYFFRNTYPLLLAATMLGGLGLASSCWPLLKDALRALASRRAVLAVAVLFAGALALRLVVLGPRHQVYFDEFLDQDVASNLARYGIFGESLAAGMDKPPILHLPSRPAGYHLLLAAVFRLFGPTEAAAFRFNALIAAACVPAMYLAAALLFESTQAGLAAAFLLAALPAHARFSCTTELTSSSALSLLTVLAAYALFEKTGRRRAFLLLLSALVFASNVRLENLILAPLIGAAAARAWRRRPPEPKAGLLAAQAAFLLLLLPPLGLFLRNRTAGLFGFAEPAGGMLGNLLSNGGANLRYLISEPATALILLPAALLGGIKSRQARLLLGLGAAYFAACSLHPSARFSAGPFERLAVPSLLCLAAAAGQGLTVLSSRFRRPALGAGAAAAVYLLLSLPYFGKGPPPRNEAEYRLVKESIALLPKDAYTLSYCAPFILVAASRPAMAASIVWDGGDKVLDALDDRGKKSFVLFKDVWWHHQNPDSEALRKFDELLKRRYRFEALKVAVIDSYEYGFYRLTRRRPA